MAPLVKSSSLHSVASFLTEQNQVLISRKLFRQEENIEISRDMVTNGKANGQYVRVKRLTDTYFISLDMRGGATAHHLHMCTAEVMNVSPSDLRLCLVDTTGQSVSFLPSCTTDDHESIKGTALKASPFSFGISGDPVVYAVLRTDSGWEQPCIVDYPTIASTSR